MQEYAVIYARYSSHNQNDASIEQQVRECREYAARLDLAVIDVYEDRAMTGKTDMRPGFQRMIRDSARKRFQFVIVWKLDRFARNRYDSASYKYKLKRNNVRVLYAKEAIPDGPEGILLESVLEGSAEYYSANLSQNVKRGLRDNALDCKANSGSLPMGYRKGADGKYELDPVGAPAVRKVFEMYTDGHTLEDIARYMNASGLTTARGNKFTKYSFYTILRNRRYTGVYLYTDIEVPGGCPQIIPQDLFDRAQALLLRNKKAPAAANTDAQYILTGKLFCGLSGHGMVGESGVSKNKRIYYYYKCSDQKKGNGCKKKPAQQQWLEDLVIDTTVSYVLSDEVINQIADSTITQQEKDISNSMVPSLKLQLNTISSSLKNVMSAIEQGIITSTTKQRLVELEQQRIDCIAAIEKERASITHFTKEQIVAWLRKFREGDSSDIEYRRTLVDSFIAAIYLFDNELRIVYNFHEGECAISLEDAKAYRCSNLLQFALPYISNPNTHKIFHPWNVRLRA